MCFVSFQFFWNIIPFLKRKHVFGLFYHLIHLFAFMLIARIWTFCCHFVRMSDRVKSQLLAEPFFVLLVYLIFFFPLSILHLYDKHSPINVILGLEFSVCSLPSHCLYDLNTEFAKFCLLICWVMKERCFENALLLQQLFHLYKICVDWVLNVHCTIIWIDINFIHFVFFNSRWKSYPVIPSWLINQTILMDATFLYIYHNALLFDWSIIYLANNWRDID